MVLLLVVLLLGVGFVAVRFWLPRSAHAAFLAGKPGPASRRYRVIAALAIRSSRTRAAQLSLVGCALEAGRPGRARALLARLELAALSAAERAVWMNNRACLALDPHDPAADDTPATALGWAEQAAVLRPDVPAIQHTRGRALLAASRIDDAIGVLDAIGDTTDVSPTLEAARCRDLATAWEHKGHAEYAADYRARAAKVTGTLRL